jgi:hypothetical protein
VTDPGELPATEEHAEIRPRECRHLLPIRIGTLGCTSPAGHEGRVHVDADYPLPDGKLAAWECRCTLPEPPGTPSGCRSFVGYHDTDTGTTTDPYAEAKDADT